MLELFKDGKISGTTHTYIGQEAIAVSLMSQVKDGDLVFSGHRCHGHYLARYDDATGLLAEMMGREGGICNGRGGSQHLYVDGFLTNGVQGGYMPIALGAAKAEAIKGSGNIVIAIIGDGTLGEGSVYETMNLAALWQVPLLILIENNRYAQTTSIEHNLSGKIIDRPRAFGIDTDEIETNDIVELLPWIQDSVEQVRNSGKPAARVIHTYRLGPHSKGDDFRDISEINHWKQQDPVTLLGERLESAEKNKIESLERDKLRMIEEEVEKRDMATINI